MGSLWTPAQITTEFWARSSDAATITLNGSDASQWDDKSGNDRHVSQATASRQPALVSADLNGKDVLRFSGDNLERTTGLAGLVQNAPGCSIFIVNRHASTSGVQQIVNVGGGANTSMFRASLGSGVVSGREFIGGRRLDSNAFQSVSSDATAGTSWAVRLGLLDYQNALAAFWKDGVLRNSGAFQTAGTSSDTPPLTLRVGANETGGVNPFAGDLAEALIINEAASTELRQTIEGYAHHWWGLEGLLAEDHPYKAAAPMVFLGHFYGTTRDKTGAVASRRIIATLDSSGECVGNVLSDPVSGEYEIETGLEEPHTLTFTGEADRNALVYTGVMPEEIP